MSAYDKLNAATRVLTNTFLDKDEVSRLLVVSVLAGENVVLIGPPGTAKSALVRTLAKQLGCQYFEYLMTRFTEPNELFGPVDIGAFRAGEYRRRTEGMLPEAELVFMDEVFKANSAILNSLLTLMNERIYVHGSQRTAVPLLSLIGASNEVPEDEDLQAIFDRFSLRVYSDNLPSHHFQALLKIGAKLERKKVEASRGGAESPPLITADELRDAQRTLAGDLSLTPAFANTYKGLVFQIRNEGIRFSDRRAVKMLKLFAASAALRGASTPEIVDLYLLKHVWNATGQRAVLAEIIDPTVDSYVEANPQAGIHRSMLPGLEALLAEVELVQDTLSRGAALTDVQLFAHLRTLNDVRNVLATDQRTDAIALVRHVDQMLEGLFASSRLADV